MKSTSERQEALRPIASLISKSEKALLKLEPGAWQHTMLRTNLGALHLASAAITREAGSVDRFTREELQAALQAFAAMIATSEKAQGKFLSGTPQHTLLNNRLRALRLAETMVRAELDGA